MIQLWNAIFSLFNPRISLNVDDGITGCRQKKQLKRKKVVVDVCCLFCYLFGNIFLWVWKLNLCLCGKELARWTMKFCVLFITLSVFVFILFKNVSSYNSASSIPTVMQMYKNKSVFISNTQGYFAHDYRYSKTILAQRR